MTVDEARKALELQGYLVVPCRAGIVAGHAPLYIDREDIEPNGFAVYIEGLTADEAHALLLAAGRMPGTET